MLVSSLPHSLLIATSRSVVPIRCLAQHHNIDVRVPSRNGSLRTLRPPHISGVWRLCQVTGGKTSGSVACRSPVDYKAWPDRALSG